MRYKRNEPFRYIFETPIETVFKINEINGVKAETKTCSAKILNICPRGIKLLSDLGIPIIPSKVIKGFSYGIKFEENKKNEIKLLDELKFLFQKVHSY